MSEGNASCQQGKDCVSHSCHLFLRFCLKSIRQPQGPTAVLAGSLAARQSKGGAFNMAKKRVSPSQKKALERARTAKRQKKGRGGEEGEEAVQQAAAATPAAPATRRRGGPAAPITGAPAARETTAAANTRARNRQTRGVQRSRRQKKERETPSVAEEEDEEEEETDEAEPSEAAGRLLRSRSLQSLSGVAQDRGSTYVTLTSTVLCGCCKI